MEERFADSGEEAVFAGDGGFLGVMVGDEVAQDLGVGLGRERVALGKKKFLHRRIIFDDAVVDERDFTVAADVRGGALASVTPPCVAQRVWPMPNVPLSGTLAVSFSSFATRPIFFTTLKTPLWTVARPVES